MMNKVEITLFTVPIPKPILIPNSVWLKYDGTDGRFIYSLYIALYSGKHNKARLMTSWLT